MIISDENILRMPCSEVEEHETNELIASLEKELNYSALMGRPGIGLSSPQINIHKKAAIVRIPTNGLNDLNVNLINAKIKEKYNPFLFKGEGCLSFDKELFDTIRYQEIYVVNNLVKPYSFVATGLFAVAIQHEIDHYEGIIFKDRAVKNDIKIKKIKPNDICFCGSNKKYKKCHLLKGKNE